MIDELTNEQVWTYPPRIDNTTGIGTFAQPQTFTFTSQFQEWVIFQKINEIIRKVNELTKTLEEKC